MHKLEKQGIDGNSNSNGNANESQLIQPLLLDSSDEQQQSIVVVDRNDQNGDKNYNNNRKNNINNNLRQDNQQQEDDGNDHSFEEDENNNNNNDDDNENVDSADDEDEYDDNDSQPADDSLTSSKLFDEIYSDNRLLIILMVITDVVMSIIGLVMQFQGCDESDLQDWNQQWTCYFLAKSIYHGLILCQFRSKSKTLQICQAMGELRTAEENNLSQQHFENQLTEPQRALTRRVLEKQMMDFYYKRNGLLKVLFYVKSLVTLSYVLYGMVVFFKGDYFAIWITNSQAERNCEYTITWWTYLSVILVIACNRQIFDIVLIIVILIPVAIFGYLPYMAYKTCKNKRKRQQAFKLFKKFKFAAGKVNGDSECAICRMDYVNGEKITVLPCNELHHFHDECITSWLNVNMSCPLCRYNFAVPDGDGEEREIAGNRRGNQNDLEEQQQGQEHGGIAEQHLQLQQQLIPVQQQLPQINNSQRSRMQSQQQSQYQPPQYYPQENNNNNNNNNDIQYLHQSQQHEQSQQQQYQSQQILSQEEQQHQEEQLSIVQSHVSQLCTIFSNENELTTFMQENDYSQPLQDEILRIYRLTHIQGNGI